MVDANETLPRYTATVRDVAEHFGVSEGAVLNWTRTTDIPHRRVGVGQRSTIRFNLAEVDAWAARGGRPAEPAEPADLKPAV